MSKFFVVSSDILPEVLEKVIEARTLLISGKAKRISEAVKEVGISRGTFYKYKDAVFSFDQDQSRRNAVVSMIIKNEKGALSKVLSLVSVKQVNVLAINQTIPINGVASLTLSVDILSSSKDVSEMLQGIENLPWVHYLKILARE